ncbi:7-cyano-7-deazaguanine synthase [Pseudomonas sp. S3E12]|uniref:7-cyano-7-deazaguanine synthase n=1 Tax=Pseudomonas sp. S3E12 TaxID=1873126 RepID=UPI0009F4C39A|nr:7-cyano-7-deazaguanine synthase [Pseudomonas sp. S3E12]
MELISVFPTTSMTSGAWVSRMQSEGLATDAVLLRAAQPKGCRCARCGISDFVDGIVLDAAGVCSECLRYDTYRDRLAAYFRTPAQLSEVFSENRAVKRGPYDCLLLYSGGKDSTYVLYQLLKMGLKVHTFTFDNGFISKQALTNISNITQKLDVEHTTLTHANMHEVFRESLTRHSTVCKGCFKALLDLSLEFAEQQGINLIVNGLSRGQIVEERLKKFYEQDTFDSGTIEQGLKDGRRIYHTVEAYSGLNGARFKDDSIFDRITLIDYFRYSDASKEDIYRCLTDHDSLWKEPEDTGFCSSNCLINDVGVYVHGKEKGYSNYEVPTSWEVRLGHLKREAALAELAPIQNERPVLGILRRINYAPRTGHAVAASVLYCVLAPGKTLAQAQQAVNAVHTDGVPPHVVAVSHIPRDTDANVQEDALRLLAAVVKESKPAVGDKSTEPALASEWLEAPPPADLWLQRKIESSLILDKAAFRRVMLQLFIQHPALRSSLVEVEGRWRRDFPMPAAGLPLQWLDLSQIAVDRRAAVTAAAMGKVLEKARAGSGGPLVNFLVLTHDENAGSSLVITTHGMVADDCAWALYLSDFQAAYVAATEGATAVRSGPVRQRVETLAPLQVPPGGIASAARRAERVATAWLPFAEPAQLLDVLRKHVPGHWSWASDQLECKRADDGQIVGSHSRFVPMSVLPGNVGAEQSGEQDFCVLLFSDEIQGSTALFPDTTQVYRPFFVGQASWLTIQPADGGLSLMWSANTDRADDSALMQALARLVQ